MGERAKSKRTLLPNKPCTDAMLISQSSKTILLTTVDDGCCPQFIKSKSKHDKLCIHDDDSLYCSGNGSLFEKNNQPKSMTAIALDISSETKPKSPPSKQKSINAFFKKNKAQKRQTIIRGLNGPKIEKKKHPKRIIVDKKKKNKAK